MLLKHRLNTLRSNLKKYGIYNASISGMFRRHTYNAKVRGISFRLSRKQFAHFYQKLCYYCGYKIKLIGIDRVDNKKGYVNGNVVSCCRWCNNGKSQLRVEDWINLCRGVVRIHGR